ncbi:MAG: diguanylate cyclase [Chitinivibrionales bacterium]|nr:diguanylate cyclase [Chitinivibrionales bacterium]
MIRFLKFSYDTNSDNGIHPKRKALWLVSGTVILSAFFVAGLLFEAGNPWPLMCIFILAAFWFLLLMKWFEGYILHCKSCIEKAGVTSRRYQNIAKYFESILQDSTDIIFTIDAEGLLLKFNKGSQIHFGYTQEEIVGKPFRILFVNEAGERKIMDAVLRSGKSVNEEIPMKTKEGEIIHLNLSISEMKDEGGQIIGMVVTAKDITEKKKLELELVKKNEMLERLAITDSLTDLYNTRYFYGQIKKELARFRRNPDRPLSLMMLDIDHFKQFNDTAGHQAGDEVLKSLARVITVCIRKDIDTGYRYGGDEFVVLLPDTDKHQAEVAAKRICGQFGSFKFGKTSLSVGIAQAAPEEDEVSLVKRADEAMYRSKNAGRARISF